MNIFLCEIAGPKAGKLIPLIEINHDNNVLLEERLPSFLLVQDDLIVPFQDREIIERDLHIIWVEVDPRVSDSGEDAPPVCVGAVDGRLDEVRVRNGLGSLRCLFLCPRSFHHNLDKLCRSFPVARDHLRQLDQNVFQSDRKQLEFLRILGQRRVLGQPICQHQHLIIRAHIPINRYAVEGFVRCSFQCFGQQRLRNDNIRGNESEHCRHIGCDHSGALCRTSYGYNGITECEFDRCFLRVCIGGHYRFRRIAVA